MEQQSREMLQNIVDDLNEKYEDSADSFYVYVTDVLDVEYRVDRQHQVRSVELCFTFGGPNIFLDTAEGQIKLHWGATTAEQWISMEICEAINEIYEELFTM